MDQLEGLNLVELLKYIPYITYITIVALCTVYMAQIILSQVGVGGCGGELGWVDGWGWVAGWLD